MRISAWVVCGSLGILASAGVVACDDETTGGGEAGGAGEGNAAAESLTKVIGADGGSIEIDGAILTFPPGAVAEDTEISAKLLSGGDADALVALPAGATYRSTPVAFTPHGLTFEKPVAVEFKYTGTTGAGLAIGRLDDEADKVWEGVGGSTFADGKATFTLSSFSVYAVTEDPDGWLDAKNYYETSTFQGFVRLEPGDATGIVEAYADQGGLPYCIQATVPASAVVAPRIRFTLNEPLPGGTPEDFVTGAGSSLWVVMTENVASGPMRVFVEDAAEQLWCAPLYATSTEGMPYSSLGTDCMTPSYDPVAAPPQVVGIELGTTGMDFTYDICVTDLVDLP